MAKMNPVVHFEMQFDSSSTLRLRPEGLRSLTAIAAGRTVLSEVEGPNNL